MIAAGTVIRMLLMKFGATFTQAWVKPSREMRVRGSAHMVAMFTWS